MNPSSLFKSVTILLLFLSLRHPADAALYSWEDQEGILNFTNSLEEVPADAKVTVLPELPPPPEAPADRPDTAVEPPPDVPPRSPQPPLQPLKVEAREVTQGTFVVQLVRELGLGQNVAPEEAADLLTRIRVTPLLGRWKLEEPITPELVLRLRTLTVSAAQVESISVAPEEALLAFDTTAALLGVPIARPESRLSDRFSPSPVLDAPPLVLINPPPAQLVSSYLWVPVQQRFFWSGVEHSGFFVLQSIEPGFHLNGHRFVFTTHLIERHFFNRHLPHPPRVDRRVDIAPPGPQPRLPERRLRGGTHPRSFSTGGPITQTPPSPGLTPITPPSGTSFLSPMAGSLRPSPPPFAPPPPRSELPASPPKRSLRGR
jgi:hypothetical protein